MALVLPVLTAILLAIAQFGILLNNYITLTDATRTGARKAAVSRLSSGDQGAAAITSVYDAASNLTRDKLKVTVTSDNWKVPGSDVVVTATYRYDLDILGWVVGGDLTSTTKERLE